MPAESVSAPEIEGQRQTHGNEGEIAELAKRQHGVVGRRQLVDLGLGEKAVEHRVAIGRLHPLHPGVYAVGHRLIPKHGWWMAAVLASGKRAALSHHSAAALWGLRGYSERAIEVLVPHKSTSSKQIRRHYSSLLADERTVEEGIPVTTVPRTIFDLAGAEPVDAIQSLVREMEFLELRDTLSLWDLIDRYPGKRGVRKLRLALERLKDEPPGRKRSKLEERFAPFLLRHRLPLPRFNDWILLGDKRYQVDCHWPGTHQIVELDGWDGHSTRTAFREDRARDRRLRVAGYSVTRLTWNQLDDEPGAVAADLRSLLMKNDAA
jgi:very-short-patch-repair endonuclease/predicted transcriptional regulator of viral defense system